MFLIQFMHYAGHVLKEWFNVLFMMTSIFVTEFKFSFTLNGFTLN